MKTFKTQKFTIIMGFVLIPFIFSCGAKSGGGDLTGETPPPNNTTTTTLGLNKIKLAASTGSSINGATDGAIDATQGIALQGVLLSNGTVILSSIPLKTTSVTIELDVTGETPGKELEWKATGLDDDDLRFSGQGNNVTEITGDIAATNTSKKISFTIEATGDEPEGPKTITVKCKYKNEGDTSTEGIYTFEIKGSNKKVKKVKEEEEEEEEDVEEEEAINEEKKKIQQEIKKIDDEIKGIENKMRELTNELDNNKIQLENEQNNLNNKRMELIAKRNTIDREFKKELTKLLQEQEELEKMLKNTDNPDTTDNLNTEIKKNADNNKNLNKDKKEKLESIDNQLNGLSKTYAQKEDEHEKIRNEIYKQLDELDRRKNLLSQEIRKLAEKENSKEEEKEENDDQKRERLQREINIKQDQVNRIGVKILKLEDEINESNLDRNVRFNRKKMDIEGNKKDHTEKYNDQKAKLKNTIENEKDNDEKVKEAEQSLVKLEEEYQKEMEAEHNKLEEYTNNLDKELAEAINLITKKIEGSKFDKQELEDQIKYLQNEISNMEQEEDDEE